MSILSNLALVVAAMTGSVSIPQEGEPSALSVLGWVRASEAGAGHVPLAGDKPWSEELVKLTSNSNLGVVSVSGKEAGWCLATQPNGSWAWNLGDGSGRLDYLPTVERQPIADGNWHLIGFSFDPVGHTAWLYYDGRPVAVYSTRGLAPRPGAFGRARFPRGNGFESTWHVSHDFLHAEDVVGMWRARDMELAPEGLSEEPVRELRVLAWNIWHGGRRDGEAEGLRKTVETIRRSGADVVAMQETYGSGPRIADALGWSFHLRSSNISVLSRYPIRTTFDRYQPFRLGGAEIELSPGQRVRVFSLWIHYLPDYGKDILAGMPTAASLVAGEGETRAREIGDILAALEAEIAESDKVSLIVAGDYNSPSHLDWTAATRERHNGLVVPWPVSKQMEAEGFLDAYRRVHPDPLADAGRTWSPRFVESWQDRIDYVYYRGSKLQVEGARMLDRHEDGWPSDHAAVLATFRLAAP